MLMPQPTLRHQRIAGHFCHLLTDHFRARRLGLLAIFAIGLIVPGVELFRPFGDVVVADDDVGEMDTAFVERFRLVADVLSTETWRRTSRPSFVITFGIRRTSMSC